MLLVSQVLQSESFFVAVLLCFLSYIRLTDPLSDLFFFLSFSVEPAELLTLIKERGVQYGIYPTSSLYHMQILFRE